MDKKIENIARAVILQKDLLLVARTIKKDGSLGHAFLPGGHIEFGETAEAALIREIKEELGERLNIKRFLGVQENVYGENESRAHEFNFIFEGQLESRNLFELKSRESHIAFEWCALQNLAAINFKPETLREKIIDWSKSQTINSWIK
jgi:ADP-ribose pyrophosphatase YjhB (NUDIX family)